ncbi:uncharacterized protein LOC120212171 [Hibiscus syriacus]|uniref:uncharacterized protein LOC120212171 n=1 Tax=Hibiscus syriacus TaxID=106335 RepID=UPI001922E79A|nr:uncharacterized protein LOC120212171 [Hibiscus syriacus]
MNLLLPDFISLNQTAFVRGRSIIDNTLLAQELVKGYGRKNISPRCALKVDLQKAFDSLNWDFISSILRAIGLPPIFTKWIETCFKEARYSISFNGSLIGYFKGQRGIRQGDPLSPILFVIAMNTLSKILNLAAARGNLDSIAEVTSVLNHFYVLSGLNLNVNKTEFYTAGIPDRTLDSIKSVTSFKQGFLPVRYLGVPLVTRKLTEKDCLPLYDNIIRRLHHWSGKILSYAGRLELIKTVLYNVVNFWNRQFILPQKVINRLEQLFSRFLWKGNDTAAKGARISWDRLCCPKSEGGLGLKNIHSWNKACMLQLIRKIMAGEGSLWVAWIHCYVIKNNDLNDINVNSSHSWTIRKLMKIKSEAYPKLTVGATKIKDLWENIRVHRDKVFWHKVIWFPLHIPKLSIISWMAILDRLPTRDRLIKMGIVTDSYCLGIQGFIGLLKLGRANSYFYHIEDRLECFHILHLGGEKQKNFQQRNKNDRPTSKGY